MLNEICKIAISAGKEIMKFYKNKKNINFSKKLDLSPLTQADINANNKIIKDLSKLTPNIPILSEEYISPWNIRRNWNKYWLIDPLDGTKEFIKQNKEFTVNIALIENAQPILGVIYAPALKLLYSATQYHSWKEKIGKYKKIIKVNKKKILKILVSRSHQNILIQKYLDKIEEKYEILKVGSSLKFCLIAEGKAHVYIRLGKTSIWDTAAGEIIASSAGAYIFDLIKYNKLNYSPRKSFFNPNFCVCSKKDFLS